jgi:L-malate glycosyltransferase
VTEVHQVLVGAGKTDAITNMARSLQSSLSSLGPSEIFAQHIAPDVADIQHLSSFPKNPSRDRIVIFHASGGDPEVFKFLQNISGPLVLIFHNIAPPELFENFAPDRAALLRQGWDELSSLREKVTLSIADSKYNAQCLEKIGYQNIIVLPAGVQVDRLHSYESDAEIKRLLEREADGPLLLYVGQAVPHKRPEILVQMQYLLTHHVGRTTSLALVGPPTLPQINAAALEQARRLRVPRCLFLGQLTESQLATLYRKASIFVTASTHEGLCLPVLEAMSFGIPVIARNAAALPDTIENAGILLPERAGPELFAEAVGELLDNPRLHQRLAKQGLRTSAGYSIEKTTTSFMNLIKGIL